MSKGGEISHKILKRIGHTLLTADVVLETKSAASKSKRQRKHLKQLKNLKKSEEKRKVISFSKNLKFHQLKNHLQMSQDSLMFSTGKGIEIIEEK